MVPDDPAGLNDGQLEFALLGAGLQHVAPITRLGIGYNSVAVLTGGSLVVRLGRHPAVETRHCKESALLPAIAPALPLTVPDPCWLAPPSLHIPYGAIAYPYIVGEEMPEGEGTREQATAIADFLVHLHTVTEVGQAELPSPADREAEVAALQDVVINAVEQQTSRDDRTALARWFADFATDPDLIDFRPVLCHLDPGHNNVLTRRGLPVAVIDWEHASWSDPMWDFDAQRFSGPHFQRWVLNAYSSFGGVIDHGMLDRLRQSLPLGDMHTIALGWRTGDTATIARKLGDLRTLGVLG